MQWSPPETRTVSRLRASHLPDVPGNQGLPGPGSIARVGYPHVPGIKYELDVTAFPRLRIRSVPTSDPLMPGGSR